MPFLASERINSFANYIPSHWHWDHVGDPSKFPSHVDLIVGPGFQKHIMPGWPADPQGVIKESDYQ